jgi:hypothetical protein
LTRSQFYGLKILKSFDEDPEPRSYQPWTRNGENQNRDPGPGSETLAKIEGKHGKSIYRYKIYMIRSFTVDVEGK